MNLSRFFTLAEMTRSDAATRASISNEPTATEIANLRALCTAVLDPLREAIGGPIKVSSGYRGPALNSLIRGAKKSQHLEGRAADIQTPGKSILDLFKTVIRLGLPFDQLIYEAQSPTVVWVHVSHNPAANRGQIMSAEFENGRAVRYPVISAEAALALADPSVRRDGSVPEWSFIESADEPDEPDVPGTARAEMPTKTRARKATKKQAAAKAKRSSMRTRAKRAAKARPAKRGTKRRSGKASSARSKKARRR
jgi:hypothetical protein